jgi:hypothetical protein
VDGAFIFSKCNYYLALHAISLSTHYRAKYKYMMSVENGDGELKG